jgi:hypothetical protein
MQQPFFTPFGMRGTTLKLSISSAEVCTRCTFSAQHVLIERALQSVVGGETLIWESARDLGVASGQFGILNEDETIFLDGGQCSFFCHLLSVDE